MTDDIPPGLGNRRTNMPDLDQLADYLIRDLSDPDAQPGQLYLDAVGDLHDGLTEDDLRQLCILLAQRLVSAGVTVDTEPGDV